MLGAPVDAVEPLHPGLADIAWHWSRRRAAPQRRPPSLCDVNDGSGAPKRVVCVRQRRGRPQVSLGGRGLDGAARQRRAPMKFSGKIAAKFGGMLCSARELGLGQDHDGILELETDAAPGTPLLDALPLADERLIVDVGPNRPDLLCHKGVARELASAYGVPFRLPTIPGTERLRRPAARRGAAEGSAGNVRIVRKTWSAAAGSMRRSSAASGSGRRRRGWRERLESVGSARSATW